MGDLDLLPSKLLSLLVRPDFWLWIGLLSALWTGWRGWQKTTGWITLSLVTAVTLVGFVPVGSVWLTPLEERFTPNPALPNPPSAIIVLGGGEDARTSAAWDTWNVNSAGDRLLHAIARAHQFPETPVLFTGSGFNPTHDPLLAGSTQRVAAMLRASGLPEDQVHSAAGARTTAEHPADIRELLMQLDLEPTDEAPLLLITSAFHMPRSIGVFCTAGFEHVIADPTDFRTSPGGRWQDAVRWDYADHLAQLQLAIREWAGLMVYQRRGQIDQLLPDGC
ncbi:MAG: YdcF family protein [Devosiaceae bacterium]